MSKNLKLYFLIKLNSLRVVLLIQHFHINFTTNLGSKLLKVGKKVMLVVKIKTNYNLPLNFCCKK